MRLIFTVPKATQLDAIEALRADLRTLPFDSDALEIRQEDTDLDQTAIANVFSIVHSSRRSSVIRSLAHVRRDEELWGDMFKEASLGEIAVNAANFTFVPDEKQRSVYIPAAELSNLPDLRNYFALYDVVILEAPLIAAYEKFEAATRITSDDLAEAARRGRLKLLVTQPEERISLPLLQKLELEASGSVIGRKAGTCYAMARLARDKIAFEKASAGYSAIFRNGAAWLTTQFGITRELAERLTCLPLIRYYDATTSLRYNDLKLLDISLGEKIWQLTQHILNGRQLPNLALEFQISGNWTSISALFEAELAISGIRSPFNFPAHLSSVFSSLSPLSAMKIAEQPASIFQYPEAPIFDFSQLRPLSELLDAVGSNDSTRVARTIFNELAGLSEEERDRRIVDINNVLKNYGGVRSQQYIGRGMALQIAELITSIIFSIVGDVYAGVGWALTTVLGFKGGYDLLANYSRNQKIFTKLGSDKAVVKEQLRLLQQIRLVASLSEHSAP